VERSQDPQPAEDEEQVVDGEQAERERQLGDVRVPQARPGFAPGVAQGVAEKAEEDGDRRDLERDEELPPPVHLWRH
jgi:hypothetical protein